MLSKAPEAEEEDDDEESQVSEGQMVRASMTSYSDDSEISEEIIEGVEAPLTIDYWNHSVGSDQKIQNLFTDTFIHSQLYEMKRKIHFRTIKYK